MIASNGPFAGDRLEAVAQSKIDAVGDADAERRSAWRPPGPAREMSIATNRARGWRCAEAIARQPEPVPTSTARGDSRWRVSARYSTTTNSDSGRGISTAGETAKASE